MSAETSDDKTNARIGLLINDDTDTAIALFERDTVSLELNEETEEFEPQSTTRTIVDPTTENPSLSFDFARAVDDSALEELGIYVEDADGNLEYRRHEARELDAVHIEWYDADKVAVEQGGATPIHTERYEDVEVTEVDGYEVDGSSLVFSATAYIQGTFYADWEEPA